MVTETTKCEWALWVWTSPTPPWHELPGSCMPPSMPTVKMGNRVFQGALKTSSTRRDCQERQQARFWCASHPGTSWIFSANWILKEKVLSHLHRFLLHVEHLLWSPSELHDYSLSRPGSLHIVGWQSKLITGPLELVWLSAPAAQRVFLHGNSCGWNTVPVSLILDGNLFCFLMIIFHLF